MTTDELRVEMRKEHPFPEAMATAVAAATTHGPTYSSVAKALHVQADTVSRWAKRHPEVAAGIEEARVRVEVEKESERKMALDAASADVAKANASVLAKQRDLFANYAGMDYCEVQRTEAACIEARAPLLEAKRKLSTLRSAEKARQRRVAEKAQGEDRGQDTHQP